MNTVAAFHLFRLSEVPGIGPVRVSKVLDWARHQQCSLVDALSDARALEDVLTKSQIDALLNSDRKSQEVREVWEQVQASGCRVLTILDDAYPRRLRSILGDRTPPVLMMRGNAALLDSTSVGFCGSRKASNTGIETARDCAEQLARNGVNLISGYASGVDSTVHRCALESGGTTTVVLPEGILSFSVKRELRESWDWDRAVAISEFPPRRRWSVGAAMQRNRTICALSKAMVLIEAGAKGGSIEAGRECLRLSIPLFAAVYGSMPEESEGNRRLLEQGACPLFRSRTKKRANLAPVWQVIRENRVEEVVS